MKMAVVVAFCSALKAVGVCRARSFRLDISACLFWILTELRQELGKLLLRLTKFLAYV